MNFLGEVEELEFSAGVADSGEAADEFSDAGAVEVIDVGEVEDDLFLAPRNEGTDFIAESADFGAEDEAAGNVEDGNVIDLAGIDG